MMPEMTEAAQAALYKAERDQARQDLVRERHRRKLAESAAAKRDTVRAEDREAAGWVRAHGGLEKVRDEWSCRGNLAPAPKVLAADGEPIEKGETLYVACTGHGITVAETYQDDTVLDTESDEWEASELTHVKPVLASDGEPLEVGQTVYHIADGKEYRVSELLKDGGAMVEAQGRPTGRCRADYLTHERPDSWERLEEDCTRDARDYCEEHGIRPEWPKHSGKAKCADLVRRARALSERGKR